MSAAEKTEKLSEPSSAPEGPPTRDQTRSRRHRDVRARTISVKRMTKRDLELGRALYPEDEHEDIARAKTRAECKDGFRPCPFVSCEHHLFLDVSAKTGAIKLNFPDIGPDEMERLPESCALDVAERGGVTLEETGRVMNLTRERVRQVEVKALAKLLAEIEVRDLRDLGEQGTGSKRRLPILQDEDDDADGEDAQDEGETDGVSDFDVDHFTSDALGSE